MSRKSNIELLRIISMILIIIFHFSDWGKILDTYNINYTNSLLGVIINPCGRLGVDIFALITGYFLINSKFSSKKITKLILQVFFYSFGLLILAVTLFDIKVTPLNVLESIFPIANNGYWFATSYVILYTLSPFLNKFLKSISKEKYKILLLILIGFYSIIPTMQFKITNSVDGTIWLTIVYMIGAYIRLYGIEIDSLKNKTKNILITITLLLGLSLVNIMFFNINKQLSLNNQYSFIVLIISIYIFEFFRNWKIKDNKIVNYISSSCFSAYLVHLNKLTVGYLFFKIICIQNYYNSNFGILTLYVCGCSLIIFIVSIFIDKIRLLLEKGLFKIFEIIKLDKIFIKLDKKINLEEEN